MDPFYGDAIDFQGYWTDRGNQTAIATYDDDEINSALLVASVYLDGAFRTQFMGLKAGGRNQIREWPRMGVQDVYGYAIPSDQPPREVINATYEAALRQLQKPGVFFSDYTRSKYKAANVSGAVSVQYLFGDATDFQTQMPVLAAILAPILTGMGSGAFSALSGSTGRV